ncbi:MAG: hypothetical protein ABIQ44_10665 [Chloroflexia bacterium]
MDPTLFTYDQTTPPEIRLVGKRETDGIQERLFVYTTPNNIRRTATIIRPIGHASYPAILYVHWLAESPDANRTQFEAEATHMAKLGAITMLVETMWSDRDWFIKRTHADDYTNSIQQTVELRQAMDILLAEPGVDPSRFAFVGHDFGAMYGSLVGAVDPRPKYYVLMAATPRYPDWYLYYPRLEGQPREDFIASMSPLDPITAIPHLSPAPILFQFANHDEHVPLERAAEFYAAAQDPKEARYYEAGHELNEQAKQDRIAWLSDRLAL